MLHKNSNHRFRISHIVVGIELQFLKLGILPDKIFDRVFQRSDNFLQLLFSRRFFDVENYFVINSQFPGDRQGIGGGPSVGIVVNRNFGHAESIGLGEELNRFERHRKR